MGRIIATAIHDLDRHNADRIFSCEPRALGPSPMNETKEGAHLNDDQS
jgi:hypothetical protein